MIQAAQQRGKGAGQVGSDWCAKNVGGCKEEAPAIQRGWKSTVSAKTLRVAHLEMINGLPATQGCRSLAKIVGKPTRVGSVLAAGWKWR